MPGPDKRLHKSVMIDELKITSGGALAYKEQLHLKNMVIETS
jgi:hypothetical protein